MNGTEAGSSSHRVLTWFDAVCIIIGTIIGAGIFKTPAVVANNTADAWWLLGIWVFGGLIALGGSLCFVELTTCYSDAGGDYAYLKRGLNGRLGFAFSWAAFWIIRPGNIGSMAIIFGEFASPLTGNRIGATVLAVGGVWALSGMNLLGVRTGKTVQNVLTVVKVAGILVVVIAALALWSGRKADRATPGAAASPTVAAASGESTAETQTAPAESGGSQEDGAEGGQTAAVSQTESASLVERWNMFWFAMVFVMFTYGGWNDIAFVASEVRRPEVNLFRSLMMGTGGVVLIYLMINLALVISLGYDRLAELGSRWENPTQELVSLNLGQWGLGLFGLLVSLSCLGAINAMIFTSPRIYWATAADYPMLRWFTGRAPYDSGGVDGATSTAGTAGGWWRAMLLQAAVTTLLILVFGMQGTHVDSDAFERITAATAQYFWLFLALTVFTLLTLRWKHRGQAIRGFRVPLYPFVPLGFIAACLFMVYRSWLYMLDRQYWLPTLCIGLWMLVGVAVSIWLQPEVRGQAKSK